MSPAMDRSVAQDNPKHKKLFHFRLDSVHKPIAVNRHLLCQHSRLMNRICDRDPTFYSFDVPRYFRSAVQNLIKYLEEDIIPAAPGQVEPGSPEALQYTELILSLCCFAEFLEIDDLANRSMDALRCHEYQCGGSLLGQHLQDLYANTKKGSKLRHFIAVSAAYFLCNAQDTVEHRAARAAISRFFESIPQFEHDILEAQSVFSEKLEVRDEDPFPACEFHTHLPGDICHASVAEDCILYIGRLSYPTTEEDLTTFFNGMGYVVQSISIPKNPHTGCLKGYAFVNLSTPSETKRAIAELSGKEIRGSNVTIQLARSKPTPAGEKRKKRERAARGGEGISGGESGCPGDGDCTARDVDNHLNQEMNVEANNDGHNYEEEVSFTEHSTERDSDYHLNEEMDFAELNADGRQVVLDVPPIPSTPPSGYTWFLRPAWFLSRTDHPLNGHVGPFASHICFEDGIVGQFEPYIPSADRRASNQHPEFEGEWAEPLIRSDSANIASRAAAPSPPAPVKDEDAYQREMREVDLYSADDTTQQTQVKTEEQEYRPSPPRHSHQTRAQVRKKFPYKCNTCNNQFPVSLQLQNHLVKHPSHHGNQGPLPSENQCTRTSKKNAKRARNRGYEANPLKCTFCQNQFFDEFTFQKHFVKHPSHLAGSQGTIQQPLPSI